MKKKLALLMAAMMTVSLVPVTAFASTKLTAVDEITTAVDKEFTSRVELKKSNDQANVSDTTTSDEVAIDGATDKTAEVFDIYATLTNGKFTKDDDDKYYMDSVDTGAIHSAYEVDDPETAGIVAVDVISDTKAKITILADVFNQNDAADSDWVANLGLSADDLPDACVLPIIAKAVDEGDVTVKVTSNVSAFKTASEVIATAVSGKVEIAVDGVRTFIEDAKDVDTVKDITIDELTPAALTGKEITLKLKGNWKFDESTTPSIKFLNQTVDTTGSNFDGDDTFKIVFADADDLDDGMLTKITISGLKIETTKKCDTGDVATITVSSKDFSSAKLEVGKMVEEAVTYAVEDDDLPVIWAGASNDETNTLELSIEENTGDILNTSRKATFTFPEGIEVASFYVDEDGDDQAIADDVAVEIDGAPGVDVDIDENVVTIKDYSKNGADESTKTDMTVKFIINAAPTFSGDVEVTLGGQFDDVSLKVATVKAPYTVEAKTTDVLIDYRYVPVNNIVITEAEEGLLDDDDVITLAVEKMDFEDAGDLEVTEGDIDADVKIDDGGNYDILTIEVKDASTEASTMTISGLELYLDRTLPVGGYALQNINVDKTTKNILWENSKSEKTENSYKGYDENGYFKYKEVTTNDEYVNVITAARDQDDSMTTKKIIITVGATTMTAGTETVTLDAPAYINAENYTMLPLRAITEAFGATVNWDDATRTVTILSGQRIISMTIGSKTMYINGTPVAMNTAPEITSSRTFVPVRDLANSLGISNINWTEASGTVTLN